MVNLLLQAALKSPVQEAPLSSSSSQTVCPQGVARGWGGDGPVKARDGGAALGPCLGTPLPLPCHGYPARVPPVGKGSRASRDQLRRVAGGHCPPISKCRGPGPSQASSAAPLPALPQLMAVWPPLLAAVATARAGVVLLACALARESVYQIVHPSAHTCVPDQH